MRCKTLSHKSLLQFYGVVGLLRHSDRGVMMLIGYARVSTQETKEQSPEKRRRTPLTTFWAAETQLGEPPHCVRSRLRRMQAPQRSSETPRLACKIAPICLIPFIHRCRASHTTDEGCFVRCERDVLRGAVRACPAGGICRRDQQAGGGARDPPQDAEFTRYRRAIAARKRFGVRSWTLTAASSIRFCSRIRHCRRSSGTPHSASTSGCGTSTDSLAATPSSKTTCG